jgi:Raf kinase inhibitor-like YbhB/YbcL family protein
VDRTGPGRARLADRRRTGFAGYASLARRLGAAAIALCCAIPLAACSNFTISAPSVMSVTSGAFQQDIMPQRYTCADPKAVSPPISWAGAPRNTRSIALVFDDSDAPITPYVYWIVFNIGPATSALPEGQLPPGARQAQNSAGRARYDAPCPGTTSHGYRFQVYALNTMLNLPPGASLEATWQAIAAATIGRGRLTVNATS